MFDKNSWRVGEGLVVNLVNNFCLVKGFKSLRYSWRLGNI